MSWNIAYTAQALRFAEVVAVAISETPMQRLLEADVCRNYYRLHDPSVIAIDDSIPEALCKIPGVQKLVAEVNGPTYALSFFPALLGALPYVLPSYLTNKHRTLLVNVVGSLLGKSYYLAILYFYNTFNPRWIWLSAMSNFIGGGDIVFYSLSQALVAESIPSQSLSSFYLYSTAVALFAKMAAGAAGLSLMNISVWIPIMISLAIKFLDIPVILFLLGISDKTGFRLVPTDEEEAALQDAETATKEDTAAPSWRSLFDRKSVIYLHAFPLGIIALYELAISMRLILPYWLSSRWHTTLQEVGFIRLGETLLTAAVVSGMPRFSRILERPADGEGSSKSRDLVLAKTCLGFTLIGTILMGFSWYKISGIVSLMVLTGGVGFEDSYLGFVTAKLQKEEIAQFYLVVGMVALGSIYVGGTAVSWVYSLCLAYGETWLTSLPVWSCALPTLCALALLQRRQV